MTGPGHYLAAERLIETASRELAERPPDRERVVDALAAAQVHATLALAAATAMADPTADFEAWDRVCGVQDPCPRCQGGGSRVTTGMVCQACGRNYAGGSHG